MIRIKNLSSCLLASFTITFSSYINVAKASPYVSADFISQSQLNLKPAISYVDLAKVKQISPSNYKYVKSFVAAEFVAEFVQSENRVEKRKFLESEVNVNCNDINSVKILQNRYFKNGKLIRVEKLNKVIRHSEANPLKEANLLVCRLFDPASSQELKSGFYSLGSSSSTRIAIQGNRICYEEIGRLGRTVASVVRDPRYLSLYKLESVEKKGWSKEPFYLIQLTSNELHYGPLIALGSKQITSSWENSKEIEQCLNSNQVFWYFQEYFPN